MKMDISVKSKNESRSFERELKNNGFKKTSDCMWVKIYEKDGMEVILSRDY